MRRVLFLAVAVMMFVPSLFAATYVVPEDRELVAASPRIVAGTVIDTYSRRGPSGMIETVTEVLVEETLKGDASERTVSVVNFGGILGDQWMVQSGAPRFTRGERVLLFLDRNERHEWTTHGLGLGAFHAERDGAGHDILTRSAEIYGFTASGAEHVERPRAAVAFKDFVRAEVSGRECAADYTVPDSVVRVSGHKVATDDIFLGSSYAIHFNGNPTPARRKNSALSIAWQIFGTQTGLDIEGGIDFADSKWNSASALIDYSRSNTPATGDVVDDDAESRVIANDPNHVVTDTCCSNGSVIATAFSGGSTAGFSFNGETFLPITFSDVVINDGASGSNLSPAAFKVTMTHELGHTLGLRHSNTDADEHACAEPLDCCINSAAGGNCKAIMNSVVISSLSALSDWDKRAIDCLYDGECASFGECVPASVATQPASKSIVSGDSTSLTVTAGGDGPFTYQWYIGEAGDTSQTTGSNSAQLNVNPTVTTKYWVRITGQCGDPADSNTATITVTDCPEVTVGIPTATKNANGSYTLNVTASSGTQTLTYAWFRGDTPGVGGTQVSSTKSFTVTITATTSYWVRVTNHCGNSSVSSLVTIALCTLPTISTQPQDQSIASGGNATLSLVTTGLVTSVNWFQGNVGNKLINVGSGTSVNVGPLTQTTTYWAAVTNACGEVASRLVTVTVAACEPPQITTEPADQTIENGAAAMLAVGTAGNVTGIIWYEGLVGDTANAIGTGETVEVHPIAGTTLYWAAVANDCGSVSTRQVVITMNAAPCVEPSIAEQPLPQFIKEHETATLTVTANGTAPLHYDWYRVDPTGLVHVGDDAPSYTTDALTQTTKYIVNIFNGCGQVHTDEVTVTVGKGRRRAARH